MQDTIDKKIEYWKNSLMDIGKRNPLIDRPEPKTSGRISRKILRIDENEGMFRLWGRFSGEETILFPVPRPDAASDDDGTAGGTEPFVMTPEKRSDILRNIRKEARLFFEEKGLNNLYVAFGFLKWKGSGGDEMRSPLILMPAVLEQEDMFKPFRLSKGDDEISANPALAQRMQNDLGIVMPEFDADAGDLKGYIDAVSKICVPNGWEIVLSAELSLFSFLKINIYRDIGSNADAIKKSPLIRAIAGDTSVGLGTVASTDHDSVSPSDVFSVVDADSSQQDAISAARKGVSFVMQGPPGTGKSQTITNIIAELLADGKKVLFVSEKAAALEVVRRRLDEAGLGDFCLTLHDHNAKRRDIIEQLSRSLELSQNAMRLSEKAQTALRNLGELRGQLNEYVREMHTPVAPLGMTVYQVNGELSALRKVRDVPFTSDAVGTISAEGFGRLERRIGELSDMVKEYGWQSDNPWRGCTVKEPSVELKRNFESYAGKLSSFLDIMQRSDTDLEYDTYEGLKGLYDLMLRFNSVTDEYDPKIFSIDHEGMLKKYKGEYASFFGRLFNKSKTDARTIASFHRTGKTPSYGDAVSILEKIISIRSADNGRTMIALMEENGHEQMRKLYATVKSGADAVSGLSGMFAAGSLPQDLIKMNNKAENCLRNFHLLDRWIHLRDVMRECADAGSGDFAVNAEKAGIDHASVLPSFKKGFFVLWLDHIRPSVPAVRDFRRIRQDERIREFRGLDREHMKISRNALKKELVSRLPAYNSQTSDMGEYGILKRELSKKRKFMPIRKLIAELSAVLPVLKPCMMMSPLSVSTYLGATDYRFDTVIFDEASQVRTEDAVGAIFRADQAVIAGDSKQLPPTNFFAKMVSEEFSDEESEDSDTGAFESLLDEAALFPKVTLRWHYRSRHEHLIAFSNAKFYKGGLTTFPSATEKNAGEGVEYIHVPDGRYEKRKGNRKEAAKVAGLVFEHFRTRPEKSLGVIAFGDAQQSMIEDEIIKMRKADPEFEIFFSEDREEPFFIKNLETVQGDERDVIIFSIGYAPDEKGVFRMFFGPLNLSGGERRLNVAVTRARYNVKLVGSILPGDIDADKTAHEGPKLLKQYIDFALNGATALTGAPDGKVSFESVFEMSVYDVITGSGYSAATQVGCSGYRIDIAVRHPSHPGRYVLGIECDGASYHSGRTARERDRLRQSVLEGMGWKIYRVWSTEWYKDPDGEGDRLIKAIKDAIECHSIPETHKERSAAETKDAAADEDYLSVHNRGEAEMPRSRYYGVEPRVATVQRDITEDMAKMMTEWLKISYGVSKDELFKTTLRSYGWKRRGDSITACMERAYALLIRTGRIRETAGKVELTAGTGHTR